MMILGKVNTCFVIAWFYAKNWENFDGQKEGKQAFYVRRSSVKI